MSTTKKLAALVGAAALTLGTFGTALAVDPVWATVTGHAASTNENNGTDFWETGDIEDCVKFNAGEGDLGTEQDTYLLTQDYELVIVKAGSTNQGDPNGLTLFANASAGETVWADTDGDSAYSPKSGPEDEAWDKNISHIIFCDGGPEQSQSNETNPPTGAPSQDTEDITESPTDGLFGNGTSSPADGAWLLVVALGALLASVVVLTPARAKSRR